MKVIVKYEIINSENLCYGMFTTDGDIIPNKRITDSITPIGGIASNVGWLKKDVHRCTDEIKEQFPTVDEIEYELLEIGRDNW